MSAGDLLLLLIALMVAGILVFLLVTF